VQIAVGIGGEFLSESVVSNVLTIAGFTTGIILGVFFLEIFTKRVDQEAALAGMLLGLVGMTVVAFATPLAWPWYAMVGSLGTLALGLLASLRLAGEPGPLSVEQRRLALPREGFEDESVCREDGLDWLAPLERLPDPARPEEPVEAAPLPRPAELRMETPEGVEQAETEGVGARRAGVRHPHPQAPAGLARILR